MPATAGNPEDPGAFSVTKWTTNVPVGGGVSLSTDLYLPGGAGPFPVFVVRHGYTRSKGDVAAFAEHVATHGFVVAANDSRNTLDDNPSTDGKDMLAVLAWVVAEGTRAGSSLQGKVDPTMRALGGHSSGGLAALVAGSKEPGLSALILLDHEGSSQGDTAAKLTTVPTLATFGEPSSCNESGGGVTAFRVLAGPRFGLKVIGASHCDAEMSMDFLCGLACGATDAARTAEFRRYATAFLERYLQCSADALAWVNGPSAKADTAISIEPETTGLAGMPGSCGSPDAGAMTDAAEPAADAEPLDASVADARVADASAPDAAAGMDAALDAAAGTGPPDAASSDGSHATPAPSSGCGCGWAGAPCPAWGLLAVVLVLLGRRRRRAAGSP